MITGGLLLGLLLGVRHALEPDHLAAVSTMVTAPGRRSGAVLLGAFWGLGHTIALLLFGGLLVLLRRQVPPRLSLIFELGVAAMLIGLGVVALRRAARGLRRVAMTHGHGHGFAPSSPSSPSGVFRWRPLAVGIVHGLAGTGALTATVFAELPTLGARLAYMALFGGGSMLGMAAVSGLAGATLSRAVAAGSRAPAVLSVVSGAISLGLGLRWAAAPLAALLAS